MKRVLIIGASGSLAKYVIEALERMDNVHLTLFLRKKERLHSRNHAGHLVIEGDAMDYAMLRNTIAGQDIVYVNLAGNLEAMTSNIVKAMQETGVQRIVAISSIGIYEMPLKPMLVPYRKLADIIEASGLDYTILRPDWFTDEDEVYYIITPKGKPETGTAVSRKSIAAFVATIVQDPALYIKGNLGISKPD